MMKKIQLSTMYVVLLLTHTSVAFQQEDTSIQGTEEMTGLFEVQDFEEPDMDLKIARTKRIPFSLSDVPFYTKVFCSYLYEEKLKKWYQAVTGYANS